MRYTTTTTTNTENNSKKFIDTHHDPDMQWVYTKMVPFPVDSYNDSDKQTVKETIQRPTNQIQVHSNPNIKKSTS